VETPETNLRRLEPAGKAIQHRTKRMAELLRPVLQVRDATSLQSLSSRTPSLGTAEIPQTCGTSATQPTLAAEDGQPTTSAVHPLARFWQSHGSDHGSRMTRECLVRFCEKLWVKFPRSTSPSSTAKPTCFRLRTPCRRAILREFLGILCPRILPAPRSSTV